MAIDPTAQIHPAALVEEGAVIGPGVRVGAFAVIGPSAVLHEGVEIKSHSIVTGHTTVGAGTVVFSFTVLGEVPQDLKYDGEATRLTIGARNTIREHVTMNIGTRGGGGETRLGDDCLLMAGVHVAHDCRIGDRVILVNNVGVAGHARIEDDVIVGGISGVHQFVRIGRGAIIGGLTKVAKDVIPYGLVDAGSGRLDGLNLIGLKRKGVPRAEIAALRAAYASLAEGDGTFQDRARALVETTSSDFVRELANFILSDSDRHFLTPGA